jgi:hypothetical protein
MSTTLRKPRAAPSSGICPRLEYLDKAGNRKRCSKAASKEVQRPIGDFVCGECGAKLIKLRGRNGLPWPWIGAGVGALTSVAIIVIAVFYLWPTSHPVDLAALCPSSVTGANADRIKHFLDGHPSADDMVKAGGFCRNTSPADATLLFRPAAELGSTDAMLALGEVYDPLNLEPGGVPPRRRQIAEALPWNAWRFYTDACKAGNLTAVSRLRALRRWADEQAPAGDAKAGEIRPLFQDPKCGGD